MLRRSVVAGMYAGSKTEIERLSKEAEILRSLSHPNIVSVSTCQTLASLLLNLPSFGWDRRYCARNPKVAFRTPPS
jgi:serine/threonine protein kinase